jgi:1,4-dihydroxy-2-naphthoate polyprenyltransferase
LGAARLPIARDIKQIMYQEKSAKYTPYQIWVLAARPRTLPAAAAPVIAGTAAAYYEGGFRPGPALAALLAALLLQIGANIANDYFDYFKGADTSTRLGPLRVTAAGLLKPQQVLIGMWITFGLAGLLGFYLTLAAGWPVLVIGLAAIAAAIAYTGGPFPFGYYGLGDLFVFIFFGLAATAGTYFVQVQSVSTLAIWSSVPMGLLITAILVVNNLRDIETDRAAGKKTLAVRFGPRGARLEFVTCLVGAYLSSAAMILTGAAPSLVLLSWGSLLLVIPLVKAVFTTSGRPLNRTLAGTGRLALVYGLLHATGLVIASLI